MGEMYSGYGVAFTDDDNEYDELYSHMCETWVVCEAAIKLHKDRPSVLEGVFFNVDFEESDIEVLEAEGIEELPYSYLMDMEGTVKIRGVSGEVFTDEDFDEDDGYTKEQIEFLKSFNSEINELDCLDELGCSDVLTEECYYAEFDNKYYKVYLRRG